MFLVPENRWSVFPGDRHGGVVVEGVPFYMKVGAARNRNQFAVIRCNACNSTSVMGSAVILNAPKSCGCSRKKHGLHSSPVYAVWKAMKDRCLNPCCTAFVHYGERGIGICDEWMDLAAFDRWATESGYRKGLTLDRIENDGNYEPGNCRWADRTRQMNNTRQNHYLTAFDETKSISEWGRDPRAAVVAFTIGSRIRKGWSPERAISEPMSEANRKMIESKRKRIAARELRLAKMRS